MNERGFERLRIAIVRRTAQDYIEALRVLHRYKGNPTQSYYCRSAEYMVTICETFFRQDCDYFVDVDGEKLMERLREKSYDFSFRIKSED